MTQPTDLSLVENQLAHFECRLTPTADPTMRVEWYHNGRPLSSGSRIRSINDFGLVPNPCRQRKHFFRNVFFLFRAFDYISKFRC